MVVLSSNHMWNNNCICYLDCVKSRVPQVFSSGGITDLEHQTRGQVSNFLPAAVIIVRPVARVFSLH